MDMAGMSAFVSTTKPLSYILSACVSWKSFELLAAGYWPTGGTVWGTRIKGQRGQSLASGLTPISDLSLLDRNYLDT